MRLTGPARERLIDALTSAFDRARLTEMVSVGLEVELDDVAGNGPLRSVTLNLIVWAEQHGLVDKLVTKAREANADNARLRTFVPEYVAEAAPPKPPAQPATRPVNQGALRQAIVTAFSASDLDLLCADVQDALQRRGVDLPVSIDVVGGAGGPLPVRVLNLIGYLNRRGYLQDLIDAVRRARPGIV